MLTGHWRSDMPNGASDGNLGFTGNIQNQNLGFTGNIQNQNLGPAPLGAPILAPIKTRQLGSNVEEVGYFASEEYKKKSSHRDGGYQNNYQNNNYNGHRENNQQPINFAPAVNANTQNLPPGVDNFDNSEEWDNGYDIGNAGFAFNSAPQLSGPHNFPRPPSIVALQEDFPIVGRRCDKFSWCELKTKKYARPQRSDAVRDPCTGNLINKYNVFPYRYKIKPK